LANTVESRNISGTENHRNVIVSGNLAGKRSSDSNLIQGLRQEGRGREKQWGKGKEDRNDKERQKGAGKRDKG